MGKLPCLTSMRNNKLAPIKVILSVRCVDELRAPFTTTSISQSCLGNCKFAWTSPVKVVGVAISKNKFESLNGHSFPTI